MATQRQRTPPSCLRVQATTRTAVYLERGETTLKQPLRPNSGSDPGIRRRTRCNLPKSCNAGGQLRDERSFSITHGPQQFEFQTAMRQNSSSTSIAHRPRIAAEHP